MLADTEEEMRGLEGMPGERLKRLCRDMRRSTHFGLSRCIRSRLESASSQHQNSYHPSGNARSEFG